MPFTAYRKPGVYTRTLYDPRSVNIAGLERLLVIIGEGREEFFEEDVPLIRGSSAYVDIPVTEDLSSKVDGATDTFKVTYYPIVRGDGNHVVDDSVYNISVTVSGNPVVPIQLDALNGEFILPIIPEEDATLSVEYHYSRADTKITAEDLSEQGDNAAKTFYVQNRPIVTGDGSGTPATETRFVTVTVEGSVVALESVDGTTGAITLTDAPTSTAEILVTYWTNIWRNTDDHLPDSNVSKVIRCGNLPLQVLYVEGTDFIVVDNKIFWGNSLYTRSYEHTPGAVSFGDNKISASLHDDYMTFDLCSGTRDGSNKVFGLQATMTDGSSKPTYDPQYLKVYQGVDPITAFQAGELAVASVEPDTWKLTLGSSEAAPTSVDADRIWAYYRHNRIADSDFEFSVIDPVAGEFSVTDLTTSKPAPLCELSTDAPSYSATYAGFDIDMVAFPGYNGASNNPDAFAPLNGAVEEIVTVTFDGPENPFLEVSDGTPVGNTGTLDLAFGTAAGGYVGGVRHELVIEIDSVVGPETFTVSIDGGSTTVGSSIDIVAGPIPLLPAHATLEGLTVEFVAITGGVVSDEWSAVINPASNTFVVTSSNAEGSDGSGRMDSTYVDPVTGLSFSMLTQWPDSFAVTRQDVDDEEIVAATGIDDAALSYENIQLGHTSLVPGSVIELNVWVDGDTASASIVLTDTPATESGVAIGNLTGTDSQAGAVTGKVYYSTGIINLYFANAPQSDTNTVPMLLDYKYYGTAGTQTLVDGVTPISEVYHQYFTAADFITFTCSLGTAPYLAAAATRLYNSIPGIQFSVSDLDDIPAEDSALLSTYHRMGQEPIVGDQYYLSYEYPKIDSDYDPKVFTKIENVMQEYGDINPRNPISMAAHLAFENGAAAVGVTQVKRATNSEYGSITGYKEALDKLKNPLPGHMNADLITLLRYDDTLVEYLENHVDTMSSDRYRSERVGYVGFSRGITPERAREISLAFNNNKITFVYPDSVVISLEDDQGYERESLVDGVYLAAAYGGRQTSPVYDAATPMTNKPIVGFTRPGRKLDPVQMNQLATSGITIIEDHDPKMIIRHAVTSNISTTLEREQNIIWIVHFTQRGARKALAPFIGVKFLERIISDIEGRLAMFLQGLVDGEILRNFRNISAESDAGDPTQANVSCEILPVFALNYISVVFSLRSRF